MERMNKKLMDGIQRNSNNARKVFSYADFRRMRNKKHESRIKNYGKISNFNPEFSGQISNQIKKIKDKFQNLFNINLKKVFIKKSLLRKATALMVIFSVLITAYFQNTNRALSATYTWTQTNWNSETSNTTGHPAPADWTEYSAADANITTGSTVTLTANSGSNTETLDADFDGTHSNTAVGSNNVILATTPTATTLTQTDDTATVASPGVQGGWASSGSAFSSTEQNGTTGTGASVELANGLLAGALDTAFDSDGIIQENIQSSGQDVIRAIATDASYVYLAGYDAGPTTNFQNRIEKRDKTTGALVTAFDSDGIIQENLSTGNDEIYAIAVDNSYLYVAGYGWKSGSNSQWMIEKRDKTTGALVTAFDTDGIIQEDPNGTWGDIVYSIAVDSSYIYLGGYSGLSASNFQWRIEKRDIATGALVTAFDSDGVIQLNPAGYADVVTSVAVDGSYLYLGGYDGISAGNHQWRIEKRDITTGALVTAFDTDGIIQEDSTTGNDFINSIAIGGSYLYAGGYDSANGNQWRIEKRDIATGTLVTAFDTDGIIQEDITTGSDFINSIAIDSSYLYLGGQALTGAGGNEQWRIEKRDIATGALVTAFDGDGIVSVNPSSYADVLNAIAVDSSYLYAGGYDSAVASGDFQWRVEKRAINNLYNTPGTYISYADAGASAISYTWNSFSWSEALNGGDISVKVKTTADAVEPSFASGTCDGSGLPITLTDSCRNSAHRYIWYQATLTAGTGNTTTPTLDQIQASMDRNFYQSSGDYTSGSIDLGQPSNFSTLGFNKTTPVEITNDYDLFIGTWTGLNYGYKNTGTAVSPVWTAESSWNTADWGENTHPAFADLDNDGDYDLLIGDNWGRSYGYKNTGTASSPAWTAESSWNTADIGVHARPAFADLDSDGDYDLLIGENNGVSFAYKNTGSVSSPTWTAQSSWNAPDVGTMSTPAFADLDNDGDYDLMIGRETGYVYGYKNTGTAISPVWTYQSSWNSPSDLGTIEEPTLADLDNDGDYDLLIAEGSGPIYAYKNTGTVSSPTWTREASWDAPDVGSVIAPALIDLDNDNNGQNNLKIQIAANNDNSTWNYIGPDGTSSTYFTSTGKIFPSSLDGNRYVRYKLYLATGNSSYTPSLDDITINYNYYPASQTLTSSKFDAGSAGNILSSIAWSESLLGGTDVKFQVRTSSDGNTWTNWCGPDNGTSGCDTGTYFTDPSGGETVDADMTDGSNDQWIQYKATLTSTGANTPTLSDVTMEYVVNASPVVSINSATQGTDGTISVNYDLSDADSSSFTVSAYADIGITLNETLDSTDATITLSSTTLLPTSGTIQIDNEQITYTGKSGNDLTGCSRGANNTTNVSHSSAAVAWAKATTASGIGAGQSAGNGKTISWTIKTDYNGAYNATGKIRVSANDGDAANQVGNGDSSAFAIDTKDPTGFAITSIDHTQDKVLITAATEDSNYEVYIDNASGTLFDAGKITSPLLNQASSYPNNYTYSSMTADPATVYVGVKDAKGNTAYVQMTTPAKPANPIYFDTSSSSQGIYQEFLAWDVVSAAQDGSGFSSYKVYRKKDSGSYSLLATVTDRNTNYYLDKIYGTDTESDPTFDPNNPSIYTYKITTNDTDGNISVYSSEVSDIPNGTGGSDSTPPTITNVAVSNINTTSATITWDTDELSNSYVGYSTDTSYLPERGLASMVTSHSITLTGLDSDTTYNIRIKSYDAIGNLGQNDASSPGNNDIADFSFDTLAGPEISSVAVDSNNTNATVSWATTTDSDTYVIFSDTVLNGALVNPLSVGTPDRVGGSPTFNHSQMITTYNDAPLISGETYYFYVTSKDASDVTAVDDNGGDFYSFSTTQDDDAPVISSIVDGDDAAGIVSHEKGVVSWTTDEPANSRVDYGTTSGDLTLSETVDTYDTSHFVILSGLDPNTTYYYTVTSADINTNEDTSIEYSFTTLRNPEEQHDPLSEITSTDGELDLTDHTPEDPDDFDQDVIDNFDPVILKDTTAVIDFNTDQSANCVISYRKDGQEYSPAAIEGENDYNDNHSIHIMGLIFSTKYYYRIDCEDNLETAISSEEFNFTTSEALYTAAGADALGDHTAPEISGVGIGTITGESAIITWDTNENANSLVKYGTTADYGKMAGNDLINSSAAEYLTSHEVIMQGLIPGTKYYFTAISIDAAGNIGESSEQTFTTKDPPKFNSINVESDNLGEVIIKWLTDEKMSSIIDYGLTTSYGDTKESSSKSLEHSLTLSSLKTSETYHFRLRGENADSNLFASADYTFVPKSPPKISNIKTESISEHSMKVSFNTDVPSDTLITYADVSDAKNAGSQGNPALVSTHEIELKDLIPGTTYNMTVRVKDEQGNETEDTTQKFTTGIDKNPPVIEKIRTESALAQSDKVQAIFHWATDEPATTYLIYKEGQSGQEKEINSSNNLNLEHVVVITSFKPGTVYYFKVKSIDAAKNEAISTEHAILTPQRKENIIQIIVNNFQDIFGWARF